MSDKELTEIMKELEDEKFKPLSKKPTRVIRYNPERWIILK